KGATLEFSDAVLFEKTNFPLSLIVKPGTQLVMRLLYDSRRLQRATGARILAHLDALIAAMIEAPAGVALRDVPMLTAAERDQVVRQFNACDTSYPRERSVVQVFEAQASRTPDAVAVECGATSLTYRQLNERANQLARVLVRAGITPDTPVALCLPRSADLIVTLVAILKSGGAYVPLDPDYPAERLSLML